LDPRPANQRPKHQPSARKPGNEETQAKAKERNKRLDRLVFEKMETDEHFYRELLYSSDGGYAPQAPGLHADLLVPLEQL
jgi:hypothetical protein